MQPLLIALQFLTRLPVRLPGMSSNEAIGRSLLCYPLVGLLIGAVLWLAAWLLGGTSPLLLAALLMAIWVGLTGALHLDGLADTVDAWIGGYGDRERTLAIMKDPRSGPMAVVVLVLLLLLKFAALVVLLESGASSALWLAPLLGRSALLGLFLTTRYVREGGLGTALAEYLPRRQGWWVLGGVALVCLLAGSMGLLALVAALAIFALLRRRLLRRLGGTTGDTAGALLEIIELAVLLALALSL